MTKVQKLATGAAATFVVVALACNGGGGLPDQGHREGQPCPAASVGKREPDGLKCTHSSRGNRWEYPGHNYGLVGQR